MKLLIVGHFVDGSLEHHYVKYLRDKIDVEVFEAENIFDEYYRLSTINKLIFKSGLSKIQDEIGKRLIKKIKYSKPDLVWVFKGMRILPEVLKMIKELGIQIINYNPDHPFYFSSKGSGNENITKSIELYDLHFCYDSRVAEQIEREYNIQTLLLPFGFELSESDFDKYNNEPEINAVGFIGACDLIRVAHVRCLADAGIEVHVYGNGWDKMLTKKSKNILIGNSMYGDDFWKTMRKYRVQLNVFKPHNIGCHNMRSFEIPAVGGIMLAPDSVDHRQFFENEKEVFIYRDKKEMIDQAVKILNLKKEMAYAIRENARKKSVDAGYSYEKRSAIVYDAIANLMVATA